MNKVWLAVGVFLLVGCTNEHGLQLDIVAADPVPVEVESWELRLLNIPPDASCPSASESARAARIGRLAHAQSFVDVGEPIGEVPEGRWAFAVLGRDTSCGVRAYGCTAVTIGAETFSPITIRVETVTDVMESCGDCRSCELGACTSVDAECD